jgi:hypothetical protein
MSHIAEGCGGWNWRCGRRWRCCFTRFIVAQGTAPRIHVRVGPNVTVWPRGGPQAEPFIVAHPSTAGVLIIGTADWEANRGLVPHAYATTDGGRTWTRASLPGLLDDLGPADQSVEGGGDPWVAFDANGRSYFSVNFYLPGKGAPVVVYESTDSGLTWQKTFALQPASWDAPKILIVDTQGTPGLLLILSSGGKDLSAFGSRKTSAIAVFRSEDRGKSFAPSALIAPGDHTYTTEHAVRLADGAVLVLLAEDGMRLELDGRDGCDVVC